MTSTLFEKCLRALSLLLPDLRAPNVVLRSAMFLLHCKRLPRKSDAAAADINDYIFWRSIGSWSYFEQSCVDKETAKVVALGLCPEIDSPRTVAAFPVAGMSFADFAALVGRYRGCNLVMKPTHGSGHILYLRDAIAEDALRSFYRILKQSYFDRFRERQYHGLRRKVLVEESLISGHHAEDPLTDYKFFCARGSVLLCQVHEGRFSGQVYQTNVTVPDFELVSGLFGEDVPNAAIRRPDHWNEMLEFAARLSAPFDFVRVDLYEREDKVFFGEFTFTPSAGFDPFTDPEYGRRMLRQVRSVKVDSPAYALTIP